MPKDHGTGGNPHGNPGNRRSTVIEVVDWPRRVAEYYQAKFERLYGVPRTIRNPIAASSLRYVIDQIPRVKAEIDRCGGTRKF